MGKGDWLEKVITHHLLQNAGGTNSNRAAQRVGQALSAKLSRLSGDSEAKPFLRAWVDWEKSRYNKETKQQEHTVFVGYREGVENSEITILAG